MVVKEYWWAGPDNKPLKNVHWARPLEGQRNDILDWMRGQEATFDHSLARSRIADAVDGAELEAETDSPA